jgi:hypothetical protein
LSHAYYLRQMLHNQRHENWVQWLFFQQSIVKITGRLSPRTAWNSPGGGQLLPQPFPKGLQRLYGSTGTRDTITQWLK